MCCIIKKDSLVDIAGAVRRYLIEEDVYSIEQLTNKMKQALLLNDNNNDLLCKIIDRSITEIVIPNYITNISEFAFTGCQELVSVVIPDGVTSIGSSAFSGCNNLTSINIPNSVTSIGSSAFSGVSKVGNWENGILYIDNHLVQTSGNTLSGECTIKDGILTIADYAFSNCNNVTSITIPSSVRHVGIGGFAYCGVTSITIPDSITSISECMFSSCNNLTSVVIPNSVISIGKEAFSYCSNLSTIVLPISLNNIDDSAFKYSSIQTINVPWAEGEVTGAPWGATNATINYNYTGE